MIIGVYSAKTGIYYDLYHLLMEKALFVNAITSNPTVKRLFETGKLISNNI